MDIEFEAGVVVVALEFLEAAQGNVWAARLHVRDQVKGILVERIAESASRTSDWGRHDVSAESLTPATRAVAQAAIVQTYLFTSAFPEQAADFFRAMGLQSLVRPDEDRRCAEAYLKLATDLKQQIEALNRELKVRSDRLLR